MNGNEPTDFTLDFEDGRVHSSGFAPSGAPLEWNGQGVGDDPEKPSPDASAGMDGDWVGWRYPYGAFEVDGKRWSSTPERRAWSVQRDGASVGGVTSAYFRVGSNCPERDLVGAGTDEEDEHHVVVMFDGSSTATGSHSYDNEFDIVSIPLSCTPE